MLNVCSQNLIDFFTKKLACYQYSHNLAIRTRKGKYMRVYVAYVTLTRVVCVMFDIGAMYVTFENMSSHENMAYNNPNAKTLRTVVNLCKHF